MGRRWIAGIENGEHRIKPGTEETDWPEEGRQEDEFEIDSMEAA